MSIELATLKRCSITDVSFAKKTAALLRIGFTDVLHSDSRGNYGSDDDVVLSTVRRVFLLHSDARTGISTQVSGSLVYTLNSYREQTALNDVYTCAPVRNTGIAYMYAIHAVSYTHLTLPTIYSV